MKWGTTDISVLNIVVLSTLDGCTQIGHSVQRVVEEGTGQGMYHVHKDTKMKLNQSKLLENVIIKQSHHH